MTANKILVNLCGPPGSGKTYYTKQFCSKHVDFKHLSIDEFRLIYQEEENAWYELMKKVVNTEKVILESSGLSWRLSTHILHHPAVKRRTVLTVVLHGEPEVFHERIKSRKKKEIPFIYKNLDIHSLVETALEQLPKKYTKYIQIDTSRPGSQEEVYQTFEKIILERQG